MNPAAIIAIISLIQEGITAIPGLVADLQAIFGNPNPAPADWEALRAKVMANSYASYVPASQLALPIPSTNAPVLEVPASDLNQTPAGTAVAATPATTPVTATAPAAVAAPQAAVSDPAPVTIPGTVTPVTSQAPVNAAPVTPAVPQVVNGRLS